MPIPLNALRLTLQTVVLLCLNPVTTIGTIWVVKINDPKIILLPGIGIMALLLGGLLGLGASRVLREDRKQAGSLFVCGAISNVGSIGPLGGFFHVFIGNQIHTRARFCWSILLDRLSSFFYI